jgi:hypothetical protein
MFQQYLQETITMSDKTPYEVFTTPVGELVYPWLSRPDTRFQPEGVYQGKLLLPLELAQDLIARLEGILKDFIATLDIQKQKKLSAAPVFEMEVDEDGNETGNVLFKYKLKALVTPREGEPFTQAPVLVYAADGSAVTDPIYGGTMAKLKGQVVPYTNTASGRVGITLRLRSVQVHELVSGDGEAGAFWSNFD